MQGVPQDSKSCTQHDYREHYSTDRICYQPRRLKSKISHIQLVFYDQWFSLFIQSRYKKVRSVRHKNYWSSDIKVSTCMMSYIDVIKYFLNLNFDDDCSYKDAYTLYKISQHMYERCTHVNVNLLLSMNMSVPFLVTVTVLAAQSTVGVTMSTLVQHAPHSEVGRWSELWGRSSYWFPSWSTYEIHFRI